MTDKTRDGGGDDGFLSRWSRRKAQAARGAPVAEAPAAAEVPVAVVRAPAPAARAGEAGKPAGPKTAPAAAGPAAPPAPTLDDVALLRSDADFSPFVRQGVAPEVKNAALRKLFSDPHFNVMDGLDIYIDDYGKPDPLPAGMLRQMVGSQLLGLFEPERRPSPEADPPGADPPGPAAALPAESAPAAALPDTQAHEDPDLRLQPDDDAGRAGPAAGAGEDGRRQP